jgi:hypothetical protein
MVLEFTACGERIIWRGAIYVGATKGGRERIEKVPCSLVFGR